MSKLLYYLVSISYALARFFAGLLLHPYQTMQLLVEEKIFVWLSLTPSFSLALLTLAWNFWIKGRAEQFLSLSWQLELLGFLSLWIIWFCVFWQSLLLYLLVRFSIYKKSEE